VAANGECAAAGDAGGGHSQPSVARSERTCSGRIPPGPRRKRLPRTPERGDRVSLVGRPVGSTCGDGGRSGPPAGERDRGGGDGGCARAAKATIQTIPIVFGVSDDPVKLGLVASLSRPGGNATGVNFFNTEVNAKRLGLLRELVPTATRVAVLVNPANTANTSSLLADVEPAARALGLQVQIFNASTSHEIDAAFAALVRERPDALFLAPDGLFSARRVQLISLAARHALPASYSLREYVEAGGLMSYGTNFADTYRQLGVYAGRILKGATPAELPVTQATKFELVINLQTAKLLGLEIPPTLLARADEVIE
jgi:putative ABC transport system substrate-binding protein